MTVYSKSTLRNKFVRENVLEALQKQYITTETYTRILAEHPVDLYTPNDFVKIGLAILTVFISLCTTGLFALFFNVDRLFEVFLIIMGIVCYVVLEIMTGQKKHYNSGVDNMLMAATVFFILAGLSFGFSVSSAVILSLVTCILCAWLAIRFVDRLAAIAATAAFLSFVFYAYLDFGEFTVSSFPYVLIIAAGGIYYFSGRFLKSTAGHIYQPLWQVISIVGLLAFYFSGNYYFVATLTEENYLLRKDSALSFPYFFWLWTMAFPLVCLLLGIQRKNIILLRAGVLLIAASVLTFRYYYSVIAAEAAMVIAGCILLGLTYILIRNLRTPKHGFVFDDTTNNENENLEGFVIGQTLSGQNAPARENKFGGGSFGGAGSGADY